MICGTDCSVPYLLEMTDVFRFQNTKRRVSNLLRQSLPLCHLYDVAQTLATSQQINVGGVMVT
jgi:hypothetical protein